MTSVRDVLDALGIASEPRALPSSLSDTAAALLLLLADGARDADELTRAAGLPSGEVAAALFELELAGLAAQGDGVYRALSPERSRVARTLA